ncbi:MAG: VOC family protein [Rhodobacteraceae bacterium]|nr:VOC family protein [Paracoccaceae bacterium]
MEQRISLITLAVDTIDRSAAFYTALGWQEEQSPDGIAAFNLLGQTLGLYPKAMLARDMGLDETGIGGFSGITLAHNVPAKEDVAPLYDAALAAGARAIKPPQDVFWGGHIAYFADPDGHVWEIAWNPFSPLGPDGAFQWSGA